MIQLLDLTVRYPDATVPAVDSLSLHVGRGELFGFIGSNGAGKTTTLKVLAGLQRPTSGTALVAGIDVGAEPALVRQKIGYLPDFFGVYEDLTCREYLEFFAAAQGLLADRRAAVVEEVLELVDLTEKAEQLAGDLSRGMQQRLGLARVLVHEPEVLLLDEPASGLDPRARVEVREILRELARMGKTVVLSSHVLADLAVACTSIAVIEQGRLLHAGPVEEALRLDARELVVRVRCREGAEATRAALQSAPLLEGLADALVEEGPNGTKGTNGTNGTNGALLRVTLRSDAGPLRDDEVAAAISTRLGAAGLTLTHLAVEGGDLEHAFMTLTKGRLA